MIPQMGRSVGSLFSMNASQRLGIKSGSQSAEISEDQAAGKLTTKQCWHPRRERKREYLTPEEMQKLLDATCLSTQSCAPLTDIAF